MRTTKLLLPIFILCASSLFAKNTSNPLINEPQKGVSIELATYRKSTLSRINYSLSLSIPKDKTKAIAINEEINFDLKEKKQPLFLDFKEDKSRIISMIVNNKPTEVNHKNEHIIIPQKSLKKGTNTIQIKLLAGDLSLNRKEEFMYTLLVPERARTFIPCFDQPDLKAVFNLSSTLPQDWEIISNAKINATKFYNGRKEVSFYPSDTIPTYLFSLVAGKFQKATRQVNGKEMNLYFRETDSAKIAQSIDSIFELHRFSLQFMEKYTNIAYPFQKLDFIAIPDFPFGGMEHVGAIDYRESSLFLDQKATTKQRINRVQLIAHETAHMWFGNLVTMRWFNDVWMKEVFANFMADKIAQQLYPNEDNQLQFLLQHHPLAYNVDRTLGSNPIRQSLLNLDQASNMYGNIIYHKSPIVMNQLEMATGKAKMQEGLQLYLKKYANSNADWNELIQILDKLSAYDLNSWNQQWINKKGRPVISFKLVENKGKISSFTLSQRGEHQDNGIWKQNFHIALVYPDSTKLIFVKMTQANQNLKSIIGWKTPLCVILNATGEGYAQFEFDTKSVPYISKLESDVERTTSYINMYENLLSGKNINSKEFILTYGKQFDVENNIKAIELMIGQFKNIYWQYLTGKQRDEISLKVENDIWRSIEKAKFQEKKRALFTLFQSIATHKESISEMYAVWKNENHSERIMLTEDDFTTLAGEIIIRNQYNSDSIFKQQLSRVKNIDRKRRFEFCWSALSSDQTVRDNFFKSLSNQEMRKDGNWVVQSLYYLHHPLRVAVSEKYIPKSLQLLEEIQATSGIFFPIDWLEATFKYYNTKTAKKMVSDFLQSHPHYNPNLRNKILQTTDHLYRSAK